MEGRKEGRTDKWTDGPMDRPPTQPHVTSGPAPSSQRGVASPSRGALGARGGARRDATRSGPMGGRRGAAGTAAIGRQ